MNKEEKTIKAIQEAVPDIMELREGCKVMNGGRIATVIVTDVYDIFIKTCEYNEEKREWGRWVLTAKNLINF